MVRQGAVCAINAVLGHLKPNRVRKAGRVVNRCLTCLILKECVNVIFYVHQDGGGLLMYVKRFILIYFYIDAYLALFSTRVPYAFAHVDHLTVRP